MRRIKFGVAFFFILCVGCQFGKKPDQISPDRIVHEDWYNNGNLKSKVWYNQQLKADSLGLWFYENGNLEVKAHFNNGKQTGSCTYYYPSGKVKSYYFYNEEGDGSAMFGQRFSEEGELVEEKGMPIRIVYEDGMKIDSGNYFEFTVISVTPPNTKVIIYTFSKENTPGFIMGTTYLVRDKMPFFRHYFDAKGKYPMKVISELNDTIRNVVRRDTLSFVVTVE
ncbi:MAG: hypothetical protein H6566_26780 [Lewinellaceae bacterium]|nr:hypothetical protein [Lewinellaceae bacterium]